MSLDSLLTYWYAKMFVKLLCFHSYYLKNFVFRSMPNEKCLFTTEDLCDW